MLLSRGFDIAHQLGGVGLAKRTKDEPAIAGARPRRIALRGRDALTPSELRVAQLAAEGRTNREIAEALFLTQRTVKTHLTAATPSWGSPPDVSSLARWSHWIAETESNSMVSCRTRSKRVRPHAQLHVMRRRPSAGSDPGEAGDRQEADADEPRSAVIAWCRPHWGGEGRR